MKIDKDIMTTISPLIKLRLDSDALTGPFVNKWRTVEFMKVEYQDVKMVEQGIQGGVEAVTWENLHSSLFTTICRMFPKRIMYEELYDSD